MKCTSCGAEFTGAFCPYCGAKAPEAASSAPVQNNNISAGIQPQPPVNPTPAAPEQNSAFVNAQQPNQTGANAYSQPTPPVGGAYQPATAGGEMFKQPKKKSKAPLIIGIVVAVIAIIGILGLCFAQTIIRSITGETAYYLLQETETVKDLLDLDANKLQKNKKVAANSTISIKSDDNNIPQDVQELISKISLYTAIDQKEGKMMLDAKGDFSGKNAELKVCADENGLGITAPGLSDTSFYISLSSALANANSDELDEIKGELAPIIKEVEEEELKDIITVEKEEVNGKKCRVVTYAFTQKVAYNALASLMEKVMANEKLMSKLESVLKTVYDYSYGNYQENPYYTPPTYDEVLQNYKELPKQLRKEAEKSTNENKVFFSIAYKGSRIVQRKLAGNEVITIDSDTSASEKTLSVVWEGSKDKVELVSFSNDGKELYLSVKEDGGEKLFDLSIHDYKVKKINGVYVPLFSLKLDYPDAGFVVRLDAQEDETYNLYFNVKSDSSSENEFTVNIFSELSSRPDFSSFEEPDKNASTDFNGFVNEVSSELNNVLKDTMDN
ncbi:MAG: hypothetical protein IKE65_07875 [Clostridia bacterium]|nr:hypothetical protein [Clostridia bacterium]